jgi:hypothetical protein
MKIRKIHRNFHIYTNINKLILFNQYLQKLLILISDSQPNSISFLIM